MLLTAPSLPLPLPLRLPLPAGGEERPRRGLRRGLRRRLPLRRRELPSTASLDAWGDRLGEQGYRLYT